MRNVITLSISVKPTLLELLDSEADKNGISRSSMISYILSNRYQAYQDTDSIKECEENGKES